MKIPTIKTKNFILRPFVARDAAAVAKNANDKAIGRNTTSIPYPYSLADAKEWLKKVAVRNKQCNPDTINFAIDINGEAAGSISLMKIQEGHKAEIGYWLGKEYRGGGIMGAAVAEIVKYGFKELKLRRIYGHVFTFNKISKKVLEKNGFKLEGILKKYARKNGRFIDVYLLAKVK
ncbi:MAG: GNAT family protein [Patescibacteria group bacterium]|jgi:RimJ/RimL family protein N-acetyltransferase